MKKRLALIGLGNLSQKIYPALKNSLCVTVVAICDRNGHAIGRNLFDDVPYYKDYHHVVECALDFVYVATNPETHYEIANYFIEMGISVLSEKPPTSSFEEYTALVEKAKINGVFYHTIYHFRYSNEILWLKKHREEFGNLSFAYARFDDPYCNGTTIMDGREALMGAWRDSASNIMGAWSFLFPCFVPDRIDSTMEKDLVHHLPIYAHVNINCGDIPFSMTISWKNNTRNKEMMFVFEKDVVYMDFPNQEVYVNGELVQKLYEEQSTTVHYMNYFNHFDLYFKDEQDTSVTELLYRY